MKNTTYADQSGTIRTLTEEEVTVVSGGAYGTTLLQSSSQWLQNYITAHPVVMAPVRPVVYTYGLPFFGGYFGGGGYGWANYFNAINSSLLN